MKAIETIYSGYKFRSRLEARWAVFFDEVGIKYSYESEGFEVAGIRYLPDFWLPHLKVWIEIKPDMPDEKDIKKILSFAWHKPLLLISGEPYAEFDADEPKKSHYVIFSFMARPTAYEEVPCSWDEGSMWVESDEGELEEPAQWWDKNVFVECRECGKIDIEGIGVHFAEQYPRLGGSYGLVHGKCTGERPGLAGSSCLVAAYTKARQKRFA